MENVFLSLTFIFVALFQGTRASAGDASPFHDECMKQCIMYNCSTSFDLDYFDRHQPFAQKLLKWDCVDECKYLCMWAAVQWFKQQKLPIPQFYGKWPFFRCLGIQEPASTMFSILNGIVHYLQLRKFMKAVPRNAPFYSIHLVYAVVSINAWIWSTIFHSRDTTFTEMMDYFSAQLVITVSTYGLLLRLLGIESLRQSFYVGVVCLAFYVKHIYYLAFVNFDYGYNMAVGITLGICNLLGWTMWSALHWANRPYVWKCATTVIFVNFLLVLEVIDFQPLWYIFDAHSLWHFGTIPIPIIWYSFAIDDCWHLLTKKKESL